MYTATDLLTKLEFEGGILNVIKYGVHAKQVPSEVEDEWSEIQDLAAQITELEAAITARLELSALDAQEAELGAWVEDDDWTLTDDNDEALEE